MGERSQHLLALEAKSKVGPFYGKILINRTEPVP